MRRALQWTGIALVAIVVLLGAALLGIDSGPGHEFIRARLAAYSTQSGLNFRAARIEG